MNRNDFRRRSPRREPETNNVASGLLFLAFVIMAVLKLLGVPYFVDASWWIITLPIWIGLALSFGMLLFGILVAAAMFAGAWVIVKVMEFCDR